MPTRCWSDSDFAFVFTSRAEALEAGGEAMFSCWQAARAKEMQDVSSGACQVLARVQLDRPMQQLQGAPCPWVKPVAMKMPSKAVLSATEASPTVQDGKVAVQVQKLLARVQQCPEHPWLQDATLHGLSVADFGEFLKRRGAKLQKFELRTLRSAELVMTRLFAFRDKSPFRNPMMVENFLASLSCPRPSYQSLKWCQRHLRFPLGMEAVEAPPATHASGPVGLSSKQAVVAEPVMLKFAGQTAERLFASQDLKRMHFVGQHCIAFGGVRLRHVQRSTLVRLTTSSVTFFCSKSKSRSREGFVWSVPRCTVHGFDIMKAWYDELCQLQLAGVEPHAICFDTASGAALSSAAIVAGWRAEFASFVSNPLLLTSYSFRRVLPTLASLLGWDWEWRLAIGNWVESPCQSSRPTLNLMPVRYSGCKNSVQVIVKLIGMMAIQALEQRQLHGREP